MTRINASIKPATLTDQHLLAEIRELPRILNTIKSGKAKVENKTDVFKLGTNHTTFFYERLKYLVKRHKDLVNEANFRRFNVMDYSESYKDLPQHLFNDWKPSNEVKQLLVQRISERLRGMKNIKYNREPITVEQAIKKLEE
ncbi:MAG: pyrimidine dimer DNA glycosylase/endonuclease V [Paraclostridium sp.]